MKKYFTVLFAFFLSVLSLTAQIDKDIPDRPSPERLVNNLSSFNVLSSDEQARLEQKLETFFNQTSNSIVVVIVNDFAGLEKDDYATRLGQKWGAGQSKEDNGIIILVQPKPNNHGDAFIAVGYGLEGIIPDLTARQITENEMIPYFKQNQYYTALDKGTDVLMSLAKKEYNSDAYAKKHSSSGKSKYGFLLIIIIVMVIISITRGGRGGSSNGGLSMGTGFFLGSMLGGGGRGFGGGGGSSGGGFGGGFGGGGFGGGGSGGSW
ncbi:MAG: hypothetical protein JWP12_1548 [Bacteroidetes bacterium]|nr:hypothetical protein [Bacteroidota bacterium]